MWTHCSHPSERENWNPSVTVCWTLVNTKSMRNVLTNCKEQTVKRNSRWLHWPMVLFYLSEMSTRKEAIDQYTINPNFVFIVIIRGRRTFPLRHSSPFPVVLIETRRSNKIHVGKSLHARISISTPLLAADSWGNDCGPEKKTTLRHFSRSCASGWQVAT